MPSACDSQIRRLARAFHPTSALSSEFRKQLFMASGRVRISTLSAASPIMTQGMGTKLVSPESCRGRVFWKYGDLRVRTPRRRRQSARMRSGVTAKAKLERQLQEPGPSYFHTLPYLRIMRAAWPTSTPGRGSHMQAVRCTPRWVDAGGPHLFVNVLRLNHAPTVCDGSPLHGREAPVMKERDGEQMSRRRINTPQSEQ